MGSDAMILVSWMLSFKAALSFCYSPTSVQFSCSVMSDSLGPHEPQHARPPCPSPTPGIHPNSSPSNRLPSSHLIPRRPLLLLSPIPPSIRVFSNESTLHVRWPKYWSFSFSIIPFNEHPGLISFRMDWLDLPAVQGTLRSLRGMEIHTWPCVKCTVMCSYHVTGAYPGEPWWPRGVGVGGTEVQDGGGIYTYIVDWHFVWQRPIHNCKGNILQLKNEIIMKKKKVFDTLSKIMKIKPKIKNLNLIKLKKVCPTKEATHKMVKTTQSESEIF